MQDCVAAEKEKPLLAGMLQFLGTGIELFAAETVVQQFELLLSQFAGSRERERWRKLVTRLEVVPRHAAGTESERVEVLPAAQSMSEVIPKA